MSQCSLDEGEPLPVLLMPPASQRHRPFDRRINGLRIGYLRETPVMVMTANHVAHDTVPYFMERFAGAYTAQLTNFVDNVRLGRPAPVTIRDGMQAMRIAVAATRACASGQPVNVASVKED